MYKYNTILYRGLKHLSILVAGLGIHLRSDLSAECPSVPPTLPVTPWMSLPQPVS